MASHTTESAVVFKENGRVPKIQSVSDVLNIAQNPFRFFKGIIDDGDDIIPLGMTDTHYPRPYPYGIWYRGQPNAHWAPVPAVFRSNNGEYYDEKNILNDIRYRCNDQQIENRSDFDLLCQMQHYGLPTRTLDWTEGILIALFFAVEPHYRQYFDLEHQNQDEIADRDAPDASLYVLNAYRLNHNNSIIRLRPGMIYPNEFDVTIRTAQAEYVYIEDAITRARTNSQTVFDRESEQKYDALGGDWFNDTETLRRMSAPIAVMPNRNNPRMIAQMSTFTLHGGKIRYFDVAQNQRFQMSEHDKVQWEYNLRRHFIEMPEHLTVSNEWLFANENISGGRKPFMKKFIIDKYSIKNIMTELDRLGIIEPMLYPEFEKQTGFAKRRWSIRKQERVIRQIQPLDRPFAHEDR